MQKHKQTLQSQREFYAAFFGDGFGCECAMKFTGTKEELNEAIAENTMMLQDSIDQGDKDEIAYWRKLIQEQKTLRRLLTT